MSEVTIKKSLNTQWIGYSLRAATMEINAEGRVEQWRQLVHSGRAMACGLERRTAMSRVVLGPGSGTRRIAHGVTEWVPFLLSPKSVHKAQIEWEKVTIGEPVNRPMSFVPSGQNYLMWANPNPRNVGINFRWWPHTNWGWLQDSKVLACIGRMLGWNLEWTTQIRGIKFRRLKSSNYLSTCGLIQRLYELFKLEKPSLLMIIDRSQWSKLTHPRSIRSLHPA